MDEQLSDHESEPVPKDKAGLLQRILRARAALDLTISQLSDAQLVAPGATGWSVKDHLAHLAIWELSLTALLQRRPRHAAMEVDEATYLRSEDAINELVYQRNKDRSLVEVLAAFRQAQQQMLAALADLTGAGLLKTYSHYQSDEPGEDRGAPIVDWIAGNTYEHYDEHRAWIEALVR